MQHFLPAYGFGVTELGIEPETTSDKAQRLKSTSTALEKEETGQR